MENIYVWAWEAKEKQISINSKIGDKVYAGYIKDGYKNNYKIATITSIRKYKFYPNGNLDEWVYKYQVTIRFEDGTKIDW